MPNKDALDVIHELRRFRDDEYMDHYHGERNHQGLKNRLIQTPAAVTVNHGASPAIGGSVEH